MLNFRPDDRISAATWLAQHGLSIFPLATDSKIPPRGMRWTQDNTTDADVIVRQLAVTFPNANYGVIAGKEFAMVDVDIHSMEADGRQTLAALMEQHGDLPPTFLVQTASGGFHYYLSLPEGVKITKGAHKLGPGVDIQHGNAYVVGPWSTINGIPYRVMEFHEIAPMPQWMIDLIADKPEPEPEITYSNRKVTARPTVSNRYVETAVRGELDRLAECARSGWNGPAWDQTCYEVACNLIEISNNPDADYSPSRARSDFMAAAPSDSKFGPRQHEAKWDSAERKIGGASRTFPAPRVVGNVNKPRPPAVTIPPTVNPELTVAPPAPPVAPPSGWDAPAGIPDDYFGKHGLLVEQLAHAVADDFGLGPDGELWLYRDGIYRPESMELLRRVTSLLRDRYRPASHAAVKDFVSALPGLPVLTNEQPDQRYIVLENGVYAWEADRLLEHSPNYGAITQLPIVYDPSALCPEFDRYLSEVVPADTIDLVWELIGYLMMFGNPIQIAIVLQGPGGNGKSTFLRVIQRMIGDRNVSALDLKQMTEDRFALAGLLGKTANLAGDIDAKYLGSSARFKSVVGGDLIEVERKYGQPFSFSPYAVPVFSANEFWKTADTTHGYFRRWLPIPFPYTVDKTRHLDENDLFDEIPGIFTRAMHGLRSLMARGKFEHSGSIADLVKAMQDASDILADWFDDDEHVAAVDPTSREIRVLRADAYEAFKRWCARSGHKGMSNVNFYKRLGQLGYGEAKIKGQRYVYGLDVTVQKTPTIGDI